MNKRFAVSLMMLVGLVGCDDPHDDKPVQSASFRIDKEALYGNVGGGSGFASTHWERYTDDRTGQTILCFNPMTGTGGTSTNIACVNEESK